jgi:hypothetical protein
MTYRTPPGPPPPPRRIVHHPLLWCVLAALTGWLAAIVFVIVAPLFE